MGRAGAATMAHTNDVFCCFVGLILMRQSWLTAAAPLAAVHPHGLALKFSHDCLPSLLPSTVPVDDFLAPLQLAAGLLLSATATASLALRTEIGLIGWLLRTAALAGAAAIAIMLLAEASIYQNHHYLLANILLIIGVFPRHCDRELLSQLRFLTSLPYVFGALSKLTSEDWMLRHQPARRWCERELRGASTATWLRHAIHSAEPAECAALLSWGGVVVDALVVPLLAAPSLLASSSSAQPIPSARTSLPSLPSLPPLPSLPSLPSLLRAVGAVLALCFHGLNYLLFHIGIFPWLMAAALVLWWEGGAGERSNALERPQPRRSPPQWLQAFTAAFAAIHIGLPLRRFGYDPRGDPTWSQEGYVASWLMKRHQTDGLVTLRIERTCQLPEGESEGESESEFAGGAARQSVLLLPQLDPWLTRHQRRFVAVRPSSLQQYAHHRALLLYGPLASAGAGAGVEAGAADCEASAFPALRSGFSSGERRCSVSARAVSCFTHNARRPQPLYNSSADLLMAATAGRCTVASAVGDWLLPLSPLSLAPLSAAASAQSEDECDGTMLHAPLDLLHEAEAGIARLWQAAEGRKAAVAQSSAASAAESPVTAPGSALSAQRPRFDGEALAWFWHELELLRIAL